MSRSKADRPLKTFKVSITRCIEHHAEVEVRARDIEHAKIVAQQTVDAPGAKLWREGDLMDENIHAAKVEES